MNLIKVISFAILQIIFIKSGHTNDISNDYETQLENSVDNKYLILIKKGENDDNVEIKNLIDEDDKGNYYLILNKDSKPVQRRYRDLQKQRENIKKERLVKAQHANKMKVITDFMKDNFLTTNYLYNEVLRIKRQRIVKDDLRRMVEYLERPKKRDIKAKVLECYSEARRQEALSGDQWGHKTNNLVINVLKDPDNYGFVN